MDIFIFKGMSARIDELVEPLLDRLRSVRGMEWSNKHILWSKSCLLSVSLLSFQFYPFLDALNKNIFRKTVLPQL